jgi:hypothetical protein
MRSRDTFQQNNMTEDTGDEDTKQKIPAEDSMIPNIRGLSIFCVPLSTSDEYKEKAIPELAEAANILFPLHLSKQGRSCYCYEFSLS